MKTRIAIATALAALAVVPAGASAKTLHFSGKAVGVKPDANMRITFDVKTGQGRPKSISNVQVTALDYRCHFGGDTERDLRLFESGTFAKSGKFEITEQDLPPAYSNDFYGKFAYPKKGKRAKPTITGWITSEFGYGPTRDEYNCLGGEEFKATPKG
jgi:hypothetical protein